MQDKSRNGIVDALRRAVEHTPLGFLAKLGPAAQSSAEQFNGVLDNGTKVVFRRRTVAVQQTEVLATGADGPGRSLPDGVYRLKEGVPFRVEGGRIDFDLVFKDPDGHEPFRQYGAWRETVAMDNPLLSLPDPLAITDVVRILAPDGEFYFAVQHGAGKAYRAYVMKDRTLAPLEDGRYPLAKNKRFEVSGGALSAKSMAGFSAVAHELTRLPE